MNNAKPKILIVDDDSISSMAVEGLLKATARVEEGQGDGSPVLSLDARKLVAAATDL